jgi:hypothetical protein
MTRTGKSNTTKIVLKTIFELRWQPAAYANESAEDAGER